MLKLVRPEGAANCTRGISESFKARRCQLLITAIPRP